MLHNDLGSTLNFIGTTEESRINKLALSSNLRFLIKLENDFSGEVKYAYGLNQIVNSRFTKFEVEYNLTEETFTGRVNLLPVGYWKYDVYEVSYISIPSILDETNSPKTEVDVLSVNPEHGVVEGLVDSGKLHVHNPAGLEEVTYVKLDSVSDNYIYPYGEVEQNTPITGDKHYKHVQTAALASWSITHNLKKYPSVSVVDSGGSQVIGDVVYHDINSLTVSFTAEFDGEAYIN